MTARILREKKKETSLANAAGAHTTRTARVGTKACAWCCAGNDIQAPFSH